MDPSDDGVETQETRDSFQEVPFSFERYGLQERDRITAAVGQLPTFPEERLAELSEATLSLDEAWIVGSYDEVINQIAQVTGRTVDIAEDFVADQERGPASIQSYHWVVEHPHSTVQSLLDITLCLEPKDPTCGRICLTQQVLRLATDRFAYWGVD